MTEDFLDEKQRAEDILLGSLGFGEDASIVSIKAEGQGYCGIGQWSDGDSFEFSYSEQLDDLERWALSIVLAQEQ